MDEVREGGEGVGGCAALGEDLEGFAFGAGRGRGDDLGPVGPVGGGGAGEGAAGATVFAGGSGDEQFEGGEEVVFQEVWGGEALAVAGGAEALVAEEVEDCESCGAGLELGSSGVDVIDIVVGEVADGDGEGVVGDVCRGDGLGREAEEGGGPAGDVGACALCGGGEEGGFVGRAEFDGDVLGGLGVTVFEAGVGDVGGAEAE